MYWSLICCASLPYDEMLAINKASIALEGLKGITLLFL